MSEPSADLSRQEVRARTLKTRAKADASLRLRVLGSILSTPEGRRYLWLELEAANIWATTYVPGSFDATAFREGERSKGLQKFNDVVAHFPGQYLIMTKENSAVEFKDPDDE